MPYHRHARTVSLGIEKSAFPSQKNNCMKTHVYRKPCVSHEGPAGRCEIQLGLLNAACWPSVSSHPHIFTSLICGESYLLSPGERFLSAKYGPKYCLYWVWVLWHTGSQCIIIVIISNIISLLHLTRRKSKLTLLLAVTMPVLTRSLGFLELFSNSPLNVFGCPSQGKHPTWPSQEPSDLSGLDHNGPP